MSAEITTTLLAGFSSLIAGFVSVLLAKKKSKEDSLEKKNISEIVKAASLRTEEAKSKAIEAIVQKLPQGLNAKEFERLFQSSLRVHGDIITKPSSEENNTFVETLVNGYHHQALSQAKVQFWFSIAAAAIGFAYILYSASNINSQNFSEYMRILPGAVIDAVAFLFFQQAEQTRQRATELYDRLRNDRQMERAESVVASIEDLKIRSAVKAQIALHMAGMKPKELDLPTFSSQPFDVVGENTQQQH